MSEKEILLTLSKDPHPFVVNLVTTFNDERYIYMVLDYIIGGEFFTHLRNAGTFDAKTATFYSASVVLVFDSLHCKDIIYRDLKPEVRRSNVYFNTTRFCYTKENLLLTILHKESFVGQTRLSKDYRLWFRQKS